MSNLNSSNPCEGLEGKELEKCQKAVQKAKDERDKQFQKDGCRTGSEFKAIQAALGTIETGIFALDMAIGHVGSDGRCGMRERDIMEICGPNGSGKTAIADQAMLTTLTRFGPESVFYLAAEPPEIERVERKGINLDHLIMRCCFDPDIDYKKNLAEQHLEAALVKAENPKTKLVVIDSVAALCSASMLFETGKGANPSYRDMDVTPVAALAKIFNNFLVQWNARNKSNSVLMLLNQYKPSIDTKFGGVKSDQVMTPGGRGMEFLSWIRIMVTGGLKSTDKDAKHSVEDTKQANILRGYFEIFKNKYAHTDNNRVVKWDLDLETGRYNNEEKLIEWASFFGTRVQDPNEKGAKITLSELNPPIAVSGWTYIGDESFQSGKKAIEYLRQNPEMYDSLKMQMYPRSKQFFRDEKPTNFDELDG